MHGQNMIMLLRTVDLLSRKDGVTKNGLAEHLGITRRSVDRLLALLEELDFPIYDEEIPLEKEKRWKLVDTYVTKLPNICVPNVQLSLSEIISLYLVKGETRLFRGTEIQKNVDSAFSKLSMFMPKGLFQHLAKIRTLFVPSNKLAKDYTGKEDIIDKLRRAIVQRNCCTVRYHSFKDDEVKDYEVQPLHFFEDNGGLYVFVNIPLYGEIRTFAVERIQDLEVSDATFDYPADFDAEEFLGSSFGIIRDRRVSVKVWFAADMAKYIRERTWAPSQIISENGGDGSIILEMDVWGWLDVKRWVLSYGPKARVIEPEDLRDEIARELEAAAAGYQ
jgi:predicted DNA-binding transcriptional regulator YafY